MLAERGTEQDLEDHTRDEERKYDGTRALIIKDGDNVVMRGRSWINDYAPNFPEIVADVQELPVEACVLDSEITYFKRGTDEDLFLSALAGEDARKETFPQGYTVRGMVFDALFLEDYDLEPLPYQDRQEILEELVPARLKHLDVVETVTKDKKAYFQSLRKKGGEGVILKERKSPYTEGARSRDWLKVKHWKSDEAVVVGYTHGEKSRSSTFGALILAQRDKQGRWRYVGKSNVASPKDQEKYARLLRKMHVKKPALVDVDVDEVGNIQAWVKPELVIEVKYLEKTLAKPKEQKVGKMRFPTFLRERHDKRPEDCLLDTPSALSTLSTPSTPKPTSPRKKTRTRKTTPKTSTGMTKVKGGSIMLPPGMKRESKIKVLRAFFGYSQKEAEDQLATIEA